MIGVNVYGLQQTIEKDLPGTFRAVKEAGFDAVELLAVPWKKQRGLPVVFSTEETFHTVMEQAKNQGLDVPSVHLMCVIGRGRRPAKAVAQTIRQLHTKHGIDTFVISGVFRDSAGARKWANYLKDIAQAVKPNGCRILYHNHTQEFDKVTVGGVTMTALDYFFSLVGEDILLQLDIGWAGVVTDEVAIAEHYRDRIVSIHLKDFIPGTRGVYENITMPADHFTAIGCGEIQTAQVLALRDQFPHFNGSIIIDQDHSTTDMLEDIRKGRSNLAAML